ncbi:MAG: DUF134 domain-containing protein [Eubacterium sp.]|nr:DUF134 domain-containing protein [Eubacterium sp.]
MPRPKRCRKICAYPDYWSFVPEGEEAEDTVVLMLDEFEAVRLIDYEKMTQEECALAMGVSRATITGIYESARHKISDSLVNGRRLQITGGSYTIDSFSAPSQLREKGDNIMRVAVTYEQEMVGQHFGKTEQFKVYDVENGQIVSSEIIDTNGTGHGALAGFLRAAGADTLICGGIGMGARVALQEAGVELLPGVSGKADDVIADYIAGNLDYDPNTQCNHHHHGEGHECGHHHGEGHECGGHGEGHEHGGCGCHN